MDELLARIYSDLLKAYFSELKGVGAVIDVKETIDDLSKMSVEMANCMIDMDLKIPRTRNIERHFTQIAAIPYNKELTAAEIEKIAIDQVITKYHLSNEVKLLLAILISRKDVNPVAFDDVFIRYYVLPVLYLKNESSSHDGRGYILFFEITRLQQMVKFEMNKKIRGLEFKQANL